MTTPESLRTSEQVAEQLGVPYRSLMRWAAEGLVQPLTFGKGNSARLWTERQINEARVVARLRGEGVALADARRALACLRAELEPFAPGNLLVLGKEACVVCDAEAIIDLLKAPSRMRMPVIVMGLDE
jgi:DNA-binding transcriptional MerR regulator